MKTFASRMAALLLAAAASMSAGAVTVFDNLSSTPETWRITYTSQWNTNLWVANRIPVGPESLRIDRVSMDLLEFDRFELQVCETSADATTPFMGACAAFTPDAATPGRRVFTGSRIVEAGNHVWVVMRSMGWSQIRFQVTNVTKDGVAWDIGTNHGTVWKASPDTSLGMAINGESVSQPGACGSAHGKVALGGLQHEGLFGSLPLHIGQIGRQRELAALRRAFGAVDGHAGTNAPARPRAVVHRRVERHI